MYAMKLLDELDYLDQLEQLDEWDDEEDDRPARRPKIYLRDVDNPLEDPDDEFRQRYRFSKRTVVDVLVPLLFPGPSNPSRRGMPIPPLTQTLIALRYYATASFQSLCGNHFKVSQSTVHRIVKAISESLCQKLNEFIEIPTALRDARRVQVAFYEKASFPGVIGVVDGTHIPIRSPGGRKAELFRNRKGYFSLNVQIVGGPNEEILDIVCRWPGSAQDSRVFENSGVRGLLEENPDLGHLLGDAGYAQKPYLFTPLLRPVEESERRYNQSHKTTRRMAKVIIGRWKSRFPCLSHELGTSLHNTLRIIPACAVLHNIGLRASDVWTDEEKIPEGFAQPSTVSAGAPNHTDDALRKNFIARYFT